jgi:hypothetical protein
VRLSWRIEVLYDFFLLLYFFFYFAVCFVESFFFYLRGDFTVDVWSMKYSLKKLISAHIIMTPLRNRSNGTLLALVLLVPVLLLIAYGGWTLLLRPAS